MEKRIQEEQLKNLLAFCTGNDIDLVKKRSSCEKLNSDINSSSERENFKEDNDHESNESESELVESEPMNHEEIIDRTSN